MARLADRIQAEIESVERSMALLPPVETLAALSELELAGTAALLHSFYNGIENILRQAVQHRGVQVPSGSTWHKELIETARRESLVSQATREELKRYLAFRHFFGHAYAFDLDPQRIEPLIERVPVVYALITEDLRPLLDSVGNGG